MGDAGIELLGSPGIAIEEFELGQLVLEPEPVPIEFEPFVECVPCRIDVAAVKLDLGKLLKAGNGRIN